MSIFNPNYKLLNKYITEADNNEDDDDYSIDDKEFDTDDDADKAADDLVNGDDESSADKAADDLVNDDTEEASDDSEADKAADDIVNDDDNTDTNDDTNTDTEDNASDTDDTNNDENPDEGDDFDISLDGDDDQGDGGDGADGDGADTGDDTGMDDTGDDTGDTGDTDSEDVTNELVGKEKEIFSDLTEDQMKIKVKELKESYTTLLSVIDDINSRVTGIFTNSNNIKIIKFILSILLDLKKIANDYLINSFNTKTYIENVIFYQTSLAQLNTIKKVLEEMADKSENKDNKKAEK